MLRIHREALNRNLPKFERCLDLDSVLPYLHDGKILTDFQVEQIENVSTPTGRRTKFIDTITRRGPKAFDALCNALWRTGQKQLLDCLRTTVGDENFFPDIQTPTITLGEQNGHQFPASPAAVGSVTNEEFYKNIIEDFEDIEETDGELNLQVNMTQKLPERYCDEEEVYRHLSRPKGFALIINNRVFRCRLPERFGTDTDCKNMLNLLRKLGYIVQVENNLTGKDIELSLRNFSDNPKLDSCDSAVIVVLSHGENGHVYGTDGTLLPITRILGYMDKAGCPALVNKPKLFFIQACRGDIYDRGYCIKGDFSDGIHFDQTDSITKLPQRADMLIAYATLPGYVSWRNSLHGSWFIQAICQTFAQFACEEEIQHLLTRVNKMVASKVSNDGCVQMPEPCNHLRRKFYFLPGIYE